MDTRPLATDRHERAAEDLPIDELRVALHAGQLLQKVPGGIGRYVDALLRELPSYSLQVNAFAAGPAPADVSPQTPWFDLGGPSIAIRYELWHRLRGPRVAVPGDIVHAPSLAVPPRDDRPLIVTVHDVAFLRHRRSTTRRGAAFHERGLALAMRDADLVLTPSEFTRNELLSEGFPDHRVRVARLGCYSAPAVADAVVDRLVVSHGIAERFILTVGTVEPRKRLEVLVEAFCEVRRTHPDLMLVVAGPKGWGSVGRLDYPGVRLMGHLPWDQIDALYRRAQACCITSVYEGFGLPAAEAMARGCPVIATTGNALAELLGDSGLLVAPEDPSATAEAIRSVLEDPALRAELIRLGPQRVKAMSWSRTAGEHAAIYEELASSRT